MIGSEDIFFLPFGDDLDVTCCMRAALGSILKVKASQCDAVGHELTDFEFLQQSSTKIEGSSDCTRP